MDSEYELGPELASHGFISCKSITIWIFKLFKVSFEAVCQECQTVDDSKPWMVGK